MIRSIVIGMPLLMTFLFLPLICLILSTPIFLSSFGILPRWSPPTINTDMLFILLYKKVKVYPLLINCKGLSFYSIWPSLQIFFLLLQASQYPGKRVTSPFSVKILVCEASSLHSHGDESI